MLINSTKILLLVVISPMVFGANIYKCKGSSGEVEYSNTPCVNAQTQKTINIDTNYNGSHGLRPGEQRMLDTIERDEQLNKSRKRQAYSRDQQNHIGYSDRERLRQIRHRELSIQNKLDKNPTFSQAIAYRKELESLQRQREDIMRK